MKYRIAMWATAGLMIAVGWAVYAYATPAPAMTSTDPMMALVELTCPIVFASMHFNFGVSLFLSLVANIATYALLGVIVESARLRLPWAK
jgi:hypothetical protein